MRDWLHICDTTHTKCKTPYEPTLPTRVLDIGEVGTTVAKLVETGGAKGRYICLSYCWGSTPFTKTTQANIESHKAGIRVSTMCQTFQDVIKVVQQLNIRYIWIDALCIIQEDAADWDREAARMAPYYSNAYLTIAASWAQSATLGLFPPAPKTARIGPLEVFSSTRHFPQLVDDLEHRLPGSDAMAFPMLTRGWCFQERLLSPRVLHFAQHELIWECRESLTCECGQVGYAYNHTPKPEFFDGISNISTKLERNSDDSWRRLVAEYTALSLTLVDDRLPALGGLADEMIRSYSLQGLSRTYVAGLWVECLLGDLCWKREAGQRCNPRDPASPDPLPYRAPSWSWASIDGHVDYSDKLSYGGYRNEPGYRNIEYATVLGAHCTPAGASKTGRVTDGHIDLECFLVPAVLKELDEPDWEGRTLGYEPLQTAYMNLQWYSDGRARVEPGAEGRYFVLPLVTIDTSSYETFHGILVQSQSGVLVQEKDERPVMVRIGFVTKRYERWSTTMKDLSRRKVRLV
ncbi:heterokaryon incompatibility protein-domain-containing protein [Microdochium trichocladiopsis]|uniref:Heterokaryon incompatibility protein-domain-containing protein n=1 Tax=Microdochium trichocladiopsis TaxID=1682393 RepID=A0A9P8YH15_9PEZI|nr:heterokaryon incompatibility protein-domain-containing protein [Microdochium trichocladiopsis]KAH7040130.1 heterokaryon incompatibility protein-domain-containing protein [Microdochium trichocladiopsis]